MKITKAPCIATALLGGVLLTGSAGADSCAQDITLELGPYATRTLQVCSIGDPQIVARSMFGEDIDAALISADGDVLDVDTHIDGMPTLSAEAYGYNEYQLVLSNATNDEVLVTVTVR